MNLTVVTPPSGLPCSIDRALRLLSALGDDVDTVELVCRAAVAACEDYTGRVFLNTVFKATLPAWPDLRPGWGINRPNADFPQQDGIALPMSPLVAITTLKYYPDGGGGQVTWAGANYVADVTNLPGRVVFAQGVELPVLALRPDAVEITFTAGHGTTEEEMPPQYLLAMLQLARHFYDNPGAIDPDGKAKVMPYSYQHLLRGVKI